MLNKIKADLREFCSLCEEAFSKEEREVLDKMVINGEVVERYNNVTGITSFALPDSQT